MIEKKFKIFTVIFLYFLLRKLQEQVSHLSKK